MMSRLEPLARSRRLNVAVGSLAAIAATAFLVGKTIGYWIWIRANWLAFVYQGINVVGWFHWSAEERVRLQAVTA